MHSALLRKENLLYFVVVLLLCAGMYTVAHGQVVPPAGEASGICLIRNGHTNIPGFYAPDIGKGYAKVAKPGANTFAGIQAACTKSDFDGLLKSYCAQNPTDTDQYGPEVVGFDKAGNGLASGGCPACEEFQFHRCPLPPPPRFDFSLSDSGNKSVTRGDSATITITATLVSGAAQPVNFTVSHSFEQAAAPSLSLSSCSPTCSSTMTIKTLSSTAPGTYSITVTGAATGGLIKTTTSVLTVKEAVSIPPPPPPVKGTTFIYPIPELGGCRNETECHAFCDNPENRIGVCWEFAKKHDLVSKEDIAKAEKFTRAAISGDIGSCNSNAECFKYCDAPEHLDECVSFAEKNGFATTNELKEARKLSAHFKKGGKTPGDCRGKESCLAYCALAEHIEECYNFAKEAGFLDKETQEQAGKFIGFMQRGETPGRCTSKDSCEAYCSEEGHFNECIAFADKAGLLSKEELEIAKKVGGRGPGGCTSRESCEAFCNEGTNQEICIKFAEEHGLLTTEELGQIKKFGSLREALGQAPPEILNCLGEQVGADIVQKLLNGVLVPNPDVIKGVRACFESGKGAIEKQLASCVSLACGEAVICLEKLRGAETKDFKFDIPSDIKEKVTGCKQEEFNQRARSCIAMPCSEAISCIQGLGEGDQKGEKKPIPGLEEKIRGCMQQMQGGGEGREGGAPPMPQSFEIPKNISPEEINKQVEEQYRTQYGEQKPPAPEVQQTQPQQIPQEYCASFAQAPSCSYVGPPDSQNYQYCKQCYPDR